MAGECQWFEDVVKKEMLFDTDQRRWSSFLLDIKNLIDRRKSKAWFFEYFLIKQKVLEQIKMKKINYIKHLNGVFHHFTKDSRLNPTHISLYIALFQLWNSNRFAEVFFVNREEVMEYSKIGSKSTYHRCIKELSHWNYIVYYPSHNPFKGSKIKMLKFETSSGQVEVHYRPKIETSTGQAVVPIYKHIQTLENSKNINKQENLKNSNFEDFESDKTKSPVSHFRDNSNLPPLGESKGADNLKTTKNKNYNEPL